MDKELDDYLCNKYPKIFIERNLPMVKSCMGRGFEHGNGWLILLDTLFGNIQEYIDYTNSHNTQNNTFLVQQFVALQVKEKFGRLRVYYTPTDNEYILGLVNMATDMSIHICEICGASGVEVGMTKEWMRTLCRKCAIQTGKVIEISDLKQLMKSIVKLKVLKQKL